MSLVINVFGVDIHMHVHTYTCTHTHTHTHKHTNICGHKEFQVTRCPPGSNNELKINFIPVNIFNPKFCLQLQ